MDKLSSSTTKIRLPGQKSSPINSTTMSNNQRVLAGGGGGGSGGRKSLTTSNLQSRSAAVSRPENQGINTSTTTTTTSNNNSNELAPAILNGKENSEKSQSPAARAGGGSSTSSSGGGSAKQQNSSSLKTTSRIGPNNTIVTISALVSQPDQSKTFSSSRASPQQQHPANRTTMVKSTVGFDRSRNNLRAQVERAIREHKIYSCVGVYPAVRKALQKRGWVEKNQSLGVAKSTNLANTSKELESRGYEDESDQAWMNRVLRDYPPDFIWVIRRDNIDWRSLHKDQIINRYPKAFFTTKVGIAACLQSIHWFSESGISDTFFPRCYRLCIDEEKSAFVDDYRLTACMGLLKWVVTAFEKDGDSGVMDPSSRVVSLAVDFAIRQVNNYVRMRRHEDIDWLMPPAFMGQHWDVFLNQYYNVVLLKGKLAPNDSQDTGKLKYEASKRALARLAPYWPQLTIDGTANIWICKPGARSRGKGIIIMNQLDKILDLLTQNNYRESNWVVQKYIERPLLVYNTKFDIRQWFVVSDWAPLTVWFYKESYIRFCTKPFSMEDFHESIHLCNNAIQCRYQNSDLRDSALPDENMWDCYTFQAYLKTQGKMDLWDSLIYPGMKQGILGVLLASQETVDVRKNCFELYGADFMLSEDLRPWLIEINSCPCMAPSTSVTARMCAQCLEDCVKVIVDRREDRNADTGMFELIYKQQSQAIPIQPFNGIELTIQGKKLSRDIDWPSIMTKYNSKRASQSGTGSSTRVMMKTTNPQQQSSLSSGLTFMDLVQRLRLKDAQQQDSVESATGGGSSSTTNNAAPVASTNNNNNSTPSTRAALANVTNQKSTTAAASNKAGGHILVQNNQTTNIFKRGQPAILAAAANMKSSLASHKSSTNSSSQSQRRVRLTTTTTLDQENPTTTTTTTTQHLSSTEATSLSTLLKSTNQPTMADLIRISQEAAQDAINRAKNSNNYGHNNNNSSSSKDSDDNSSSMDSNTISLSDDHSPRSHSNQTKSSYPKIVSGTSAGGGGGGHHVPHATINKIRPNSRTHSVNNSAIIPSSSSVSSSSRSTSSSNKTPGISLQNSGSKGKELDGTATGSHKYGPESNIDRKSQTTRLEHCRPTHDGLASVEPQTISSSKSSVVDSSTSASVSPQRPIMTTIKTTTTPGSSSSSKNVSRRREHFKFKHKMLIISHNDPSYQSNTTSNAGGKKNLVQLVNSSNFEEEESSRQSQKIDNNNGSSSCSTSKTKTQQDTTTTNVLKTKTDLKKSVVEHENDRGELEPVYCCDDGMSSSVIKPDNDGQCLLTIATSGTERQTNDNKNSALTPEAEIQNDLNTSDMLSPAPPITTIFATEQTTADATTESNSSLAQVPNSSSPQPISVHPEPFYSKDDESLLENQLKISSKLLFAGKDTNNNNIHNTFNANSITDCSKSSMACCIPQTNETPTTVVETSKDPLIDEKPKLTNPYFPLNLTSHDSIDDDVNNIYENDYGFNSNLVNHCLAQLTPPPMFRRFKLPRTFRINKSSTSTTSPPSSLRLGGSNHPSSSSSSSSSSHNKNNNRRRLSLHQHHHQPCYRIALEHPRNQAALFSSKKFLATLPLKTVNLNLT